MNDSRNWRNRIFWGYFPTTSIIHSPFAEFVHEGHFIAACILLFVAYYDIKSTSVITCTAVFSIPFWIPLGPQSLCQLSFLCSMYFLNLWIRSRAQIARSVSEWVMPSLPNSAMIHGYCDSAVRSCPRFSQRRDFMCDVCTGREGDPQNAEDRDKISFLWDLAPDCPC